MDEYETVPWAERSGGLFEPDVILPVQFFRALRGKTVHGGERRLAIAVLDDAISCFQKNLFARDRRGRRLFREAETWLMSRDPELPFSFENICEFLALDPDYIRSGIRRWTHIAVSQDARRLDLPTNVAV
ncbi:MAG: hypothetical protein ACHQ9S_16255 [Candidatus Binatia bacterium]